MHVCGIASLWLADSTSFGNFDDLMKRVRPNFLDHGFTNACDLGDVCSSETLANLDRNCEESICQ